MAHIRLCASGDVSRSSALRRLIGGRAAGVRLSKVGELLLGQSIGQEDQQSGDIERRWNPGLGHDNRR